MGEPAREYSWRTFEPGETTGQATRFAEGNKLSTRSGAWSPRFVTETMEELRPQLQTIIDEAPWCRPIDELALLDMLRDMARAERLERWLDKHGDRYPDDHKKHPGELRDRDLRELGALRNRLLTHRARLGLDPASRGRMNLERRLGLDVAAAMAAIAAQSQEQGEHEAGGEAGEEPNDDHGDDRVSGAERGGV